jgi:hypothetical protein
MTDIYKMTVDLNMLDHLGINLYSNIAAVVVETGANAWGLVERQSTRGKAQYRVVEIGGDE